MKKKYGDCKQTLPHSAPQFFTQLLIKVLILLYNVCS